MMMHFRKQIVETSILTTIIACAMNAAMPCVFAQTTGTTGGPGWSDALPYYNRGNRYMTQGRYEDALHDYQEAVAKCDTDSDFFVNLGTAYEKCSDYVNAQKAFEKAISLNKEDWSGYNNLANSFTKQDRLADAVNAFEQALKRKPPAADAEAIKKDIADIKKIMEAKGMSTASSSKASTAVSVSKQIHGMPAKPANKPVPKAVTKSVPSETKAPAKDWGY